MRRYALLALALFLALAASSQQAVTKSAERLPVYISSDNHVFVQVRVNHSAPLWFVLDSGASDLLINTRVAEALGLRFAGHGEVFGVGKGPVDVLVTEEATVHVGRLCSFRKQMSALALDTFESYFGREVAGVIGYDLFSRFVVEIDYLHSTLTLQKNHSYSGAGQTLPITFDGNLPEIDATIKLANREAVSGRFIVDTGAHLALALNTPFVERNKLLASAPRTIRDPWSPGLAGEAKLLLERAQYLQLGTTTLDEPVIAFSQDRDGSLASDTFDGVIGGEILRRFKVIFDYAQRRVILEPNADLHRPYVYSTEMIGVAISAEGKDFRSFLAHRVVAGSPAAKAGLQTGDVIAEIDGQATEILSLDQLRQILKQNKPQYLMTIKRGQQTLPVRIKSEKIL